MPANNGRPDMDPDRLRQRLSELECLYEIEKILSGNKLSPPDALLASARLLPSLAGPRKRCCARIRMEDRDYLSEPFAEEGRRESFPIRAGGKTVGSLDLFCAGPGEADSLLSESERDLLAAIAARLGQFINHCRIERELRDTSEQLLRNDTERQQTWLWRQAVLSLSAEIAGCQTQDEICRLVVEGIRSQMGIDRCGLFLSDPNDPRFHGTYGTDMSGKTVDEHYYFWDIRKERDIEDLFAGIPFKTGFPLGSPEPQPGEEGLCSNLIALRKSGKVFGIISVDNRITRTPVTDAQMYHISLLAEVLGNALQIAGTRAELRDSVARAKRANEELAAFNQVMVGRENRMIELKEEINQLLAEQNKPPRYPPVWDNPQAILPEQDRI